MSKYGERSPTSRGRVVKDEGRLHHASLIRLVLWRRFQFLRRPPRNGCPDGSACSLVRLSKSSRRGTAGGMSAGERVVDLAGDEAFEATDDVLLGKSPLGAACTVGARAGGQQRIRAAAIMWRARLAWRSPPRPSRCRSVRPEEAGTGAAPHGVANAASVRRRSGLSPAATKSWTGGLLGEHADAAGQLLDRAALFSSRRTRTPEAAMLPEQDPGIRGGG